MKVTPENIGDYLYEKKMLDRTVLPSEEDQEDLYLEVEWEGEDDNNKR